MNKNDNVNNKKSSSTRLNLVIEVHAAHPGYKGHFWDPTYWMLYSRTWIKRTLLGPNLVDVIQ